MSYAAAIAAGGAIIGGVIQSQGAKKAGNAAAAGADASIAEQRRQFDLIRSDTAPYRSIGNQALNALGGIYGYSPTSTNAFAETTAGATPYTPQAVAPSGFGNTGTSAALNPWSVTSKLGSAGKWLDPAGGLVGNLFGGGHGDENRNLKAFGAESGVMQLPDGRLALPDGTIFDQSQLKDVAGTWYGAKHAPDGNQAEWQQRYDTLTSGLRGGQPAITPGQSTTSAPANALTSPDYSAFFKSPDYQFRKDQGMQGIGNSFSASGGAKSGNALKALADFNSNLAGSEFGNYFSRQTTLAGYGQTATNTSAQAGLTTGANVGNSLINGANSRASGIEGQYGAYGDALNGIGMAAGYYNARRKPNNFAIQPWTGYGGSLA